MQIALIPPKCLLNDTNKTNVQLMLPQLMQMTPGVMLDDYSFTYREHCRDPLQYVIMDNGAAEKEQMSNEDLIKILREFEPDEFALPDVLGDRVETLLRTSDFFANHQADLDRLNLRRTEELKLGFVAQGKTVAEVVRTVDSLDSFAWNSQISTIYIPRLLVKESDNPYARLEVLNHLIHKFGNRFEYHLFGAASIFPFEVAIASTYDELRSMDTSLPYQLSYARKDFDPSDDTYPVPEVKRSEHYFDLPVESFHYHARNVMMYLEAGKFL